MQAVAADLALVGPFHEQPRALSPAAVPFVPPRTQPFASIEQRFQSAENTPSFTGHPGHNRSHNDGHSFPESEQTPLGGRGSHHPTYIRQPAQTSGGVLPRPLGYPAHSLRPPPQYGQPPWHGKSPQYVPPPQDAQPTQHQQYSSYWTPPQYGVPSQNGDPTQYGHPSQYSLPPQYGNFHREPSVPNSRGLHEASQQREIRNPFTVSSEPPGDSWDHNPGQGQVPYLPQQQSNTAHMQPVDPSIRNTHSGKRSIDLPDTTTPAPPESMYGNEIATQHTLSPPPPEYENADVTAPGRKHPILVRLPPSPRRPAAQQGNIASAAENVQALDPVDAEEIGGVVKAHEPQLHVANKDGHVAPIEAHATIPRSAKNQDHIAAATTHKSASQAAKEGESSRSDPAHNPLALSTDGQDNTESVTVHEPIPQAAAEHEITASAPAPAVPQQSAAEEHPVQSNPSGLLSKNGKHATTSPRGQNTVAPRPMMGKHRPKKDKRKEKLRMKAEAQQATTAAGKDADAASTTLANSTATPSLANRNPSQSTSQVYDQVEPQPSQQAAPVSSAIGNSALDKILSVFDGEPEDESNEPRKEPPRKYQDPNTAKESNATLTQESDAVVPESAGQPAADSPLQHAAHDSGTHVSGAPYEFVLDPNFVKAGAFYAPQATPAQPNSGTTATKAIDRLDATTSAGLAAAGPITDHDSNTSSVSRTYEKAPRDLSSGRDRARNLPPLESLHNTASASTVEQFVDGNKTDSSSHSDVSDDPTLFTPSEGFECDFDQPIRPWEGPLAPRESSINAAHSFGAKGRLIASPRSELRQNVLRWKNVRPACLQASGARITDPGAQWRAQQTSTFSAVKYAIEKGFLLPYNTGGPLRDGYFVPHSDKWAPVLPSTNGRLTGFHSQY